MVRAASTFEFKITPETEPNHIYCTRPWGLCGRLENFCSRMNLGGLCAEALMNVITNSWALLVDGNGFSMFFNTFRLSQEGENRWTKQKTPHAWRGALQKNKQHTNEIKAARISPPTTRRLFLLSRAEWFARRPGPNIIWIKRVLFWANLFSFQLFFFLFVSAICVAFNGLPDSQSQATHGIPHDYHTTASSTCFARKVDLRGALQLKWSRCNCELKLSARFNLSAFCFCTMTMQVRPKRSWNKLRSSEWCKYLRK